MIVKLFPKSAVTPFNTPVILGFCGRQKYQRDVHFTATAYELRKFGPPVHLDGEDFVKGALATKPIKNRLTDDDLERGVDICKDSQLDWIRYI